MLRRLAIWSIAFLTLTTAASARVLKLPRPGAGIRAENARTGDRNWPAPDAPARNLEGYASELSVLPGESLHLHVSSRSDYRVDVYRLGSYGGRGGRRIECLPACDGSVAGRPQPRPTLDPLTGEVRAGWPVTDVVPIGLDWETGYYAARLVPVGGGQASLVLFVVKAPQSERSQILVVAAANTWEAYNAWGGKSLYDYNSDGHVPATHVSFERPWTPGSQGQFFAWGIHMVRFLEREGYDVSYTTDLDVDRDPAELLRHRLVIVNGHDEYWTKGMRNAYEDARDRGVNLMFMGANDGYWQIRYENDRRTIVAYKSKQADPVADRSTVTVQFRDLDPPRYECSLMGVQHEDWIERVGDAPRDYSVVPAALGDPWFAGTSFTATSTLPGLVGPEWDEVVPPKLAWTCNFTSLTTFFHYEGTPGDGRQAAGNADAVRYIAPSGSIVFSAGSLQFVWGLDDYRTGAQGHADPRLQRFVENAIADMTRAPQRGVLTGTFTPGG